MKNTDNDTEKVDLFHTSEGAINWLIFWSFHHDFPLKLNIELMYDTGIVSLITFPE